MSEKNVEDVIDSTKQQDRISTGPESDDESLPDAAERAYDRIDNGDLNVNITVRDEPLAGLFEALSETGQLADVEDRADEYLDRQSDEDTSKASVARSLLRVGLDQVAPDTLDDAADGYAAYNRRKASEAADNF